MTKRYEIHSHDDIQVVTLAEATQITGLDADEIKWAIEEAGAAETEEHVIIEQEAPEFEEMHDYV